MSNPEFEPTAGMDLDVRFMRKGKHSVFLYLPKVYHAPIGLVIAYWGNFEVVFNSSLAGLIDGEQHDGVKRDTEGWQRQKFKRRRRLFRTICEEWLADWKPDEAKKLMAICDTAGDLGWKRNMIAHGTYGYTVLPKSSKVVNCRARNDETGEEMPFDLTSLRKLYHDISHLTAELVLTFASFAKIEGPFVALPDKEILRVYRETNRRPDPMPEEQQPPPQS